MISLHSLPIPASLCQKLTFGMLPYSFNEAIPNLKPTSGSYFQVIKAFVSV
jgi:hypothetical protein